MAHHVAKTFVLYMLYMLYIYIYICTHTFARLDKQENINVSSGRGGAFRAWGVYGSDQVRLHLISVHEWKGDHADHGVPLVGRQLCHSMTGRSSLRGVSFLVRSLGTSRNKKLRPKSDDLPAMGPIAGRQWQWARPQVEGPDPRPRASREPMALDSACGFQPAATCKPSCLEQSAFW